MFSLQAEHKKTLFYIEQLIFKHQAHAQTTGMKQNHGKKKKTYQTQEV